MSAEASATDAAAPSAVARVRLKPGKALPFYARHPWVFDSAVASLHGNPANGDVVDLVNEKGKFVARGVFNGNSRLIVRLYGWEEQTPLDLSFWRERLQQAISLRRQLGYGDPAGAERLVYSEADGLSGLVVDRYADHLVVQVNALAVQRRLDLLVPLLQELTGCGRVTLRSDDEISRQEGLSPLAASPDDGSPTTESPDAAAAVQPISIVENGLRFQVDLAGHKTGWYLDQRENRRAVAAYMRGARVLDVFCYTGAFAVTAAVLGGAREVLGVDGSVPAIAQAQAHATTNGAPQARFQRQDGFEALEALASVGERFDAVILDPPKFTRGRKALGEALRAYHRINRLAVELLPPGGILVTCSCSGAVTREDFFDMLRGVAQKSRRSLQVLEQRGAAPDHPVAAACPESEYLKCFICRVV